MSANFKVPPPLSARDKHSFAYDTIHDRLPVIVVKIIDFFHRQRKELHKFGGTPISPTELQLSEIEKDAKDVISKLSKLRQALDTNKSLQYFEKLNLEDELAHFNDDVELWIKALDDNKQDDDSPPCWYESPWLLVECYLYRMIKNALLNTKHLKMFDPFVEQKQAAAISSTTQMIAVSNHLKEVEETTKSSSNLTHPSERSEFGLFLQLALWSNKSDLSLSGMSADEIKPQKLSTDIRESLNNFRDNILCDNMSEVWFKVQNIKSLVKAQLEHCNESGPEKHVYIDLVADNAGYELFCDLCLIHFLTLMFGPEENKVLRFRIHVKKMPWFVSDALKHDIDWLINYLVSNQDENLQAIGGKWKAFFSSCFWEVHNHKFWTLPHEYTDMKSVCKDLYTTLESSSLIIFKGDLNYRKLVGDRKWHLLTPFRVALRDFTPAPLVTLRTCKADVVVGIEDINIFAKINNNELPRNWMISGDYGLVQFIDPN